MSSFLEAATEIAQEAGSLLARYFQRGVGYEYKRPYDLVTEADRAAEALVVERLRARFPNHSIVAEETGFHERGSEYCWYVDPLDGTTNFAHGFPVFNVTLALERAGELLVGVTYDPTRQELFTAERGAGAYLNHHRIHVSRVSEFSEALFATGFPTWRRHRDVNVHFFHQVAMLSHGVRRAGSAALDLAYVACGRLDGFWEFGLNPWDMAAGVLLIQEAGGRVTDMKGRAFSLRGPHVLASNGLIHDQALELFGEIFRGQYRVPLPTVTVDGD